MSVTVENSYPHINIGASVLPHLNLSLTSEHHEQTTAPTNSPTQSNSNLSGSSLNVLETSDFLLWSVGFAIPYYNSIVLG